MKNGDYKDNEAQGEVGPALGSLLGATARLALWEERIAIGEPVIIGGESGGLSTLRPIVGARGPRPSRGGRHRLLPQAVGRTHAEGRRPDT